MPVAHWSFFKVSRMKVYEILWSKFEQGCWEAWVAGGWSAKWHPGSSFWTWCYQQPTQISCLIPRILTLLSSSRVVPPTLHLKWGFLVSSMLSIKLHSCSHIVLFVKERKCSLEFMPKKGKVGSSLRKVKYKNNYNIWNSLLWSLYSYLWP